MHQLGIPLDNQKLLGRHQEITAIVEKQNVNYFVALEIRRNQFLKIYGQLFQCVETEFKALEEVYLNAKHKRYSA